jgi:hypothetical protein
MLCVVGITILGIAYAVIVALREHHAFQLQLAALGGVCPPCLAANPQPITPPPPLSLAMVSALWRKISWPLCVALSAKILLVPLPALLFWVP